MYYVYVLRSSEDRESFYLGYTSDLRKRVKEHNQGLNKSTRGKQWQLVYYEAYVRESYARKREQKLKHNRRMKQFLLQRILESLK